MTLRTDDDDTSWCRICAPSDPDAPVSTCSTVNKREAKKHANTYDHTRVFGALRCARSRFMRSDLRNPFFEHSDHLPLVLVGRLARASSHADDMICQLLDRGMLIDN